MTVIYKDKFTITGINSAMRAHVRFGHISLDKSHCIQQTRIQTGSVVNVRITNLNCSCCYLTKAKRVLHVSRNPKRARIVQFSKQGGVSEPQMRSEVKTFWQISLLILSILIHHRSMVKYMSFTLLIMLPGVVNYI